MTRPIKGPRDIQLDLEMITVNTVINFRGSSVIRLRIYVSQYPFWAPGRSLWHCLQLHQGTEKRRNQREHESETDVRPFLLNVSWGVSMSPDHASIITDPSLWRTYFPSFYDTVIEKHYHRHTDLRSTVIFQGLQFISIVFKENRLGLRGLSPRSKTVNHFLSPPPGLLSISHWLLLCQGPPKLPGMLGIASLLLACTEGYRKKPQNDLKVFKESISKPCLVFSAIREVLVVLKFV